MHHDFKHKLIRNNQRIIPYQNISHAFNIEGGNHTLSLDILERETKENFKNLKILWKINEDYDWGYNNRVNMGEIW